MSKIYPFSAAAVIMAGLVVGGEYRSISHHLDDCQEIIEMTEGERGRFRSELQVEGIVEERQTYITSRGRTYSDFDLCQIDLVSDPSPSVLVGVNVEGSREVRHVIIKDSFPFVGLYNRAVDLSGDMTAYHVR